MSREMVGKLVEKPRKVSEEADGYNLLTHWNAKLAIYIQMKNLHAF
jgi:hypothetical protein